MLIAMLAIQPICVFGASTVSWPNPIGEEVYRPHLLRDMLPIAVIVCAIIAGLVAPQQFDAKPRSWPQTTPSRTTSENAAFLKADSPVLIRDVRRIWNSGFKSTKSIQGRGYIR